MFKFLLAAAFATSVSSLPSTLQKRGHSPACDSIGFLTAKRNERIHIKMHDEGISYVDSRGQHVVVKKMASRIKICHMISNVWLARRKDLRTHG